MSFIIGKSNKSIKEIEILDETINFNNVDIITINNDYIDQHIFNYKIIYLNKHKIKLITTRIDSDCGWDFNLEIRFSFKSNNKYLSTINRIIDIPRTIIYTIKKKKKYMKKSLIKI